MVFIVTLLYIQGCKPDEPPIKTISIKNKVKKNLPFNININKDPYKSVYFNNFDSIFQKDKIIKLETNSESLINEITKIEYHNNKIYIFDSYGDKSVICFDENGKFKFKLKKVGRGPGEYVDFVDANINKNTGDIEILPLNGKNLLLYDSLGNFKQSIKLPIYAGRFCSLKGIRFFYKDYTIEHYKQKESFRLYSIDSNGMIKKYLKFKSNATGVRTIGHDNFTRYNDNEYRFTELYNDTIYRITPEGIEALYKIDFIGYENIKPKDFLMDREKYQDNREAIVKKLRFPYLSSYHEHDNFITGYCIKFVDNIRGAFQYIYDIENNNLLQFGNSTYYKSLNAYSSYFSPEFYIKNSPATYFYPDDIDETIKKIKNPEFKLKAIKFFEFDSIIDDNPYIIKYKPLR